MLYEERLRKEIAMAKRPRPPARKLVLAGQRTGRTANLVVDTLMNGIDAVVYGARDVFPWLSGRLQEKLKDVPPEKLADPDRRIALPAIQALTYSMNDEIIREMYASLLASDMQLDGKEHTHPAFVELIRQMTSSDAKLLEIFRTTGPQIRFIALIRDRAKTKNLGFALGGGKSKELGLGYSFDFDHDPARSLDNLERLGLVERRTQRSPILDDLEHIEQSIRRGFAEAEAQVSNPEFRKAHGYGEDAAFHIEKQGLYLTRFGVSFVAACLPK
jgi:hypothetical protein